MEKKTCFIIMPFSKSTIKGDELNKYAQSLQGQAPSAAANIGVENKKTFWHPIAGETAMRTNPEFTGAGMAARTGKTSNRTASLPGATGKY